MAVVTQMRKARWYWTRLRIMDRRELVHRVLDFGWVTTVRARYKLGWVPGLPEPQRLGFCTSPQAQLPRLRWSKEPNACSEDDLRRWPALGFPWSWSQGGNVWHRAPDTNKSWPRTFFGAVPYRQGNPYGDARVVWEPSRLQQLVWLARIALQSKGALSDAALDQARAQLIDWVEHNPPWTGVHYISAMECALRFIAVSHSLDMLRSRFSPEDPVWDALAAIVASHPGFISKRVSKYSSSGNHAVAEATALVYAGVLFPELKAAERWLETGIDILCEEVERQVLPDGGGVEQSLHYHKFVLELVALVGHLLRYHRMPFPQKLDDALNRGVTFLSYMRDDEGRLPSIGDSDSGYALSSDLEILPLGYPSVPDVKEFKDSGYTVIRSPSPDSIHLVFDHGPFGMAPAYGHAHCDALGLTMAIGGIWHLLDPGTYTYTGERRLRTYFRSSRAHNTVTVNGRDPAKQESAFQWSRTFRARLIDKKIAKGESIRLLGFHSGYQQDGVAHWRYVGVFGRPVVVVVIDLLIGTGEHALELNWHMPAGIVADVEEGFRMNSLSMSVEGGRRTLIFGDSTTDPRGWCSPVYGKLEPAACVSAHYHGTLPHEFVSIFRVNDAIIDRPAIDRELTQARQWIAEHRNA